MLDARCRQSDRSRHHGSVPCGLWHHEPIRRPLADRYATALYAQAEETGALDQTVAEMEASAD